MPGRVLIAAAALMTLAGCAVETFGYTVTEYGEVRGMRVRLGCRDTYEVFDRRDARRFVVVTNGVNEALAGSCTEGPALPRPERMRRVAEAYLLDTTRRPECTISAQRELTSFHTEFEYRCAGDRSERGARRSR